MTEASTLRNCTILLLLGGVIAGCADLPRPPMIPLPSPTLPRPPLVPLPTPQAYYGHHVYCRPVHTA
jgi:hypothetical protein